MAHIGQKTGFGTHRRFRLLLGMAQIFFDGTLSRDIGDEGDEIRLVPCQPRVANAIEMGKVSPLRRRARTSRLTPMER
jgi:hypothetical protein